MNQADPSDAAYAADHPAADWDEPSIPLEADSVLPGRRRGRWLTGRSALLFAMLLGTVGFYAGIHEEKSSASSSSSAAVPTASASTAASRSSTARSGAPSSRSGSSKASSGSVPSFAAGGAGPGGAAGAGGTSGSVTSVKGKTVYVKESSGDTVAVKLLDTTTLTKAESASANSVHPGDSVVIAGSTGSGGAITATSVTDEGDSSTSSTTSSTSGSTGSTG